MRIGLRIGLTEAEVRRILRTPTAKYRTTLVFSHEHEQKVRNEPFSVEDDVYTSWRRRVGHPSLENNQQLGTFVQLAKKPQLHAFEQPKDETPYFQGFISEPRRQC